MDARRHQQSSCSGSAAALLMLLLAVSFGGHHHLADGALVAPAPGAGGMTELQKHVAFFDTNHDGIVSFDETVQGLQAVGIGDIAAKASATLINGALGPKTRPDNANSSSSRMDIYIENIAKGKHGSDTGSYDTQGRFVPAKFEEIFTEHAKTVPNALTKAEIDAMVQDNRQPNDIAGWLAAKAEWGMLYKVAQDKDGNLPKDTVRAVYDGSLFYQLAAAHQS